jgi:hypothetical protein
MGLSQSKIQGRLGMNLVERLALKAGWKPIPMPEDLDTGIDGLLELEEIGRTQVIAFQVKRGNAYFDAKGPKCQCSRRHLIYWRDHVLPVVLIVVSEDESQAFWLEVREYARINSGLMVNDSHTVRVPKTQAFDVEALKGPIRRHTSVPAFGEVVVALTDNTAARRLSALSLLYHYRLERSTPFCLAAALRTEEDLDTLATFCDFYSRYFPHPEVSFGAPAELSEYARSLLVGLPQEQLLRILEAFNDDEFGDWDGATEIFSMTPEEYWCRHDVIQRGTIQQGIALIVEAVAAPAELLAIAGDHDLALRLRKSAIALFAYLGYSCSIEELDVIAARTDDAPLVALLTWLRHWTIEDSEPPARSS